MGTSKKTSIGNQKAISDNSDVREEVAPESLHALDKSYTKNHVSDSSRGY